MPVGGGKGRTLALPKTVPSATEVIKAELRKALREKYGVQGRERGLLLEKAKLALTGLGQSAAVLPAAGTGRRQRVPLKPNLLQLLDDNGNLDLTDDQRAAAYYLLQLGLPGYMPPAGRDELKKYGIDYSADHYLGAAETPLYTLVETYAGTAWGQKAFIDLLHSSTESDFHKEYLFTGLPPHYFFVEVVGDIVTRFLDEHPDMNYRLEALYSAGRAYETLWSLSRAKNEALTALGMDLIQSGYFKSKGDDALAKAIGIYQDIKTHYGSSLEARYVSYILPELLAAKDTGAREYMQVRHK
jgi:hypothetical protein